MTATYRTGAALVLAAAVAVRISPGDGVSEDAWRAAVAALATFGAIRLARRCDPRIGADESWSPWVAAVLYGSGPVLMAAALRTPFDALVYATLPWLAAPLTRASTGWRYAASALWLALAGLGSAPWALAAVGTGIIAATPRGRTEVGDSLRWLMVAVAAAGWWVVAWALDPQDLSVGAADTLTDGLARTAGVADLAAGWSALILGGPALCLVAYLLWRPAPGSHRLAIAALGVAAAGYVVWFLSTASPSGLPVGAPVEVPDALVAHGLPATANVLAAAAALAALGGLLSWVPLTAHLVPRANTRHVVATIVLVVVAGVSGAGVLYAAHERVPGTRFDQAIAGFSTHA